MADIVFPGVPAGPPIGQDLLPANQDLVLYRGDYISFMVALRDSQANPLDLAGYTAKCSVRTNYNATESFDAECTVNAAAGTIFVEFPSSVTSTIPGGDYIWDFQTTTADGKNRTHFAGDVKVYEEITK